MEKQGFIVRIGLDRDDIQRILEIWASDQEAIVRPVGRLVRTYKAEGENVHWHISGTREAMGTVEVTYMPSSGRFTVLVQENRKGSWGWKGIRNPGSSNGEHY